MTSLADSAVGASVTASPHSTDSTAPEIAAPLTDTEFSDAVAAVTSAFGDPTRRQIYLYVRDRSNGVTASEVADHFALHSNVARHHLDKLAGGGYLEVFVNRSSGGGAGRPSKRYRASGRQTGFEAPRQGDDLLIMLLGRALALVPPTEAEAMAQQVGEEYGRRLAATLPNPASRRQEGRQPELSAGRAPAPPTVDAPYGGDERQQRFREALHTIAGALTAHGFAAHAEARGGSLALIKETCPFFDTAKQHPVICAVDRGMVRGMLTGIYGQAVP
ncbi:MAG: helix-turn-helix domain-containing protein, partial [Actinomycetota bacterium]|nr:helix-turn-helix domain-containing protein [Actinomycetota bacterium]